MLLLFTLVISSIFLLRPFTVKADVNVNINKETQIVTDLIGQYSINYTGDAKVHDNGEIAGVGYGTATLTLKSADGFCKYSWKCTVTDKGTTCWYTQSAGD